MIRIRFPDTASERRALGYLLGCVDKGEVIEAVRSRLNEHVGKISKRQNITLDDMKCRYITFASEWWVFAAEFALMSHYEPEWNDSGIGSKTPGVGRPGTHRVSRWDQLFPKKS